EGGRFVLRATHGMSAEHIAGVRAESPRLGRGTLGRAAAAQAPYQVADILAADDYAGPISERNIRAGYRALLAVPLIREGNLIGLVVRRRTPGEFSADRVSRLETFASQSTLAIQNARLFGDLQNKSRELETLSHRIERLYRLSTAMQQPLSLKEQLHRVLDSA